MFNINEIDLNDINFPTIKLGEYSERILTIKNCISTRDIPILFQNSNDEVEIENTIVSIGQSVKVPVWIINIRLKLNQNIQVNLIQHYFYQQWIQLFNQYNYIV